MRIKYFLFCTIILQGIIAYAGENYTEISRKIVILSSLKNPSVNPFWRSSDYEISSDIEKQFRDYFKNSGYQLIFEHQASAFTLEKYLMSADTLALFWVSHARGRSDISKEVITDFFGNNISDVFQKIHPRVKFLGLVGCSAKSILEENFQKGYYENNLYLLTHSFSKTVRLNKGIRQSVKASAEILDRDPKDFLTYKELGRDDRKRRVATRQTLLAPVKEIEIVNPIMTKTDSFNVTVKNILRPSIVTIGQKFIALLDPGHQSQVINISKDLFYRGQFKLKLTFLNDDESRLFTDGDRVEIFIEDENFKELIKRQMPDSSSQFIYIIPSSF